MEDLHDLPAVTAATAAAEDEPSAGDLHDPPAVTAAAAAAEDEPSAEDEPKPKPRRARTGENRWGLWGPEIQAAQAALALVDKTRKEEEELRRTTRPSARPSARPHPRVRPVAWGLAQHIRTRWGRCHPRYPRAPEGEGGCGQGRNGLADADS